MAVDRDGAVGTLYSVGVGPTIFFAYPRGVLADTALGKVGEQELIRRVRQLVLTAAGEQALAETVPAMLRAQEQILAPLPEPQRGEFMRMLQLLVTQNNEMSRAPSDSAVR
jgi:hypothetical protein